MVMHSSEEQAAIDAASPPWAFCPIFRHVWCHAPWQCVQPCEGLMVKEPKP